MALKKDKQHDNNVFFLLVSYIAFQVRASCLMKKQYIYGTFHSFLPLSRLPLRHLPLCFLYDLASHIPRHFISILTCRNTIPSVDNVGLSTFCDTLVILKSLCLQKKLSTFSKLSAVFNVALLSCPFMTSFDIYYNFFS